MMHSMAVPGVAEAECLYGEPQVCTYDLGDCGDVDRFWEMWEQRQAEVVLVLRRPNGRVALQTKAFYPAGTFRLPSGGIRPGEDLLAAVRRETQEETGLAAQPLCFLGILRYRFRRLGVPAERESYVFLLDAGPAELRPQDEAEQITASREVPPAELAGVAAQLSAMAGEWRVWGRFRALAHGFVAGVLSDP